MALLSGPAPQADDEALVATINTTPLVDVMLVLLIIFLITIPAVNYSIQVALPKEHNEVRQTKPQDVVINVDAQGHLYWYDARLPDEAALLERLKQVARQQPQPEVQVRGDARSRYEPVGRIVLACQRAGITKVGFLVEPPPRS